MTTNMKPFAVSDLLRESHRLGLITAREKNRAGLVWAKGGPLTFRLKGWNVTVPAEALDCDCGKGLHCPLTEWKQV